MAVRKIKEITTQIDISRNELMSLLVNTGIVRLDEWPNDWSWYINHNENGLVVHWKTEVKS